MAAPIVNDRVGEAGGLFSGKKFWIAKQVPTRNHWVNLVKENGGEVVLLEDLADILIADHARKNAAPGTISWKFIQDSVEKGRLEDTEKYPAGPPVGVIRPVGAAQPPRKSRIPFTAADDHILANWVAIKGAKGSLSSGNAIYQELEKIHPHHTFQSWRDRWIKYIQHRPQSEFVGDATSSHAHEPSAASISSRRHVAKLPEPLNQDLRSSEATAEDTSDTAPKLPGAALSPYTSDHLLKIHESSDANLSGHKITYEPPTTPTCRFPAENIESPRSLEHPIDPSISPSFVHSTASGPDHIEYPTGATWLGEPLGGLPFTFEEYKGLTEMYDDIMNIDENKVDDAWQVWAESNPRHTAQEWQNFWEKNVKPKELFPSKKLDSSKSLIPVKMIEAVPETTLAKKYESHFRRKLAIFSAEHRIDVDFFPTLGGRRISLFKLFRFIRQPEVGGFDKIEASGRWPEIASFLGLNTFRDPSLASGLKRICEHMLADFSDMITEYWDRLNDDANRGELLNEEEKTDLELFAPQSLNLFERGPEPDREDIFTAITEFPASESLFMDGRNDLYTGNKSMDTSSKRPLQMANFTPRKRQKIDKGKGKMLEIPSTPEIVMPSRKQTYRLSPPKFNISKSTKEDMQLASGDKTEGTSLNGPLKLNMSSGNVFGRSPKEIHQEPETQDFSCSSANKADNHPIPVEDVFSIGDSVAAMAGSIHQGSSTQSQSDSQQVESELQEIIDHYVALRYPEDTVRKALGATTMETGDLGIVVESLASGSGIPDDIQGVWTENDDRVVMLAEDAEEYAEVITKHGGARCDVRKRFLNDIHAIQSL